MAIFTLAAFKTGMTRLASKAGASAQALWDMVDCKLNAAGNPVSRPAARLDSSAPAGTKGLVMFGGKRHVFASSPVTVADPYVVNIIPHPQIPDAQLAEILLADPLMNELYVVARFTNGDVRHFYLSGGPEGGVAWQPNTVYLPGQSVRPTTPNGMVYDPGRVGSPAQLWKPGLNISQGDIVEPRIFNGFRYVADEVLGDPASTGTVEPTWPASVGGTVVEDANADPDGGDDGGQQQPAPTTPPRYDGGSGGYGGGSAGGTGDYSNQVIQ